jgi:hypothetical protein
MYACKLMTTQSEGDPLSCQRLTLSHLHVPLIQVEMKLEIKCCKVQGLFHQ